MPLRSRPARLRYATSLAGWFALTLSTMGTLGDLRALASRVNVALAKGAA